MVHSDDLPHPDLPLTPSWHSLSDPNQPCLRTIPLDSPSRIGYMRYGVTPAVRTQIANRASQRPTVTGNQRSRADLVCKLCLGLTREAERNKRDNGAELPESAEGIAWHFAMWCVPNSCDLRDGADVPFFDYSGTGNSTSLTTYVLLCCIKGTRTFVMCILNRPSA